ncbi:putative membrane protein [Photobacterium leiognathi lrivu.4.1]|uniref:Putative membrane protein n=1 Tax=Photobacterium leiognathi lrivu.4.1 TaxID=1248232 RepID=V5F6W8_PHOLE|nr:putative membrane protein [Photobacterium leiognathi lrivu.4.1]
MLAINIIAFVVIGIGLLALYSPQLIKWCDKQLEKSTKTQK